METWLPPTHFYTSATIVYDLQTDNDFATINRMIDSGWKKYGYHLNEINLQKLLR